MQESHGAPSEGRRTQFPRHCFVGGPPCQLSMTRAPLEDRVPTLVGRRSTVTKIELRCLVEGLRPALYSRVAGLRALEQDIKTSREVIVLVPGIG